MQLRSLPKPVGSSRPAATIILFLTALMVAAPLAVTAGAFITPRPDHARAALAAIGYGSVLLEASVTSLFLAAGATSLALVWGVAGAWVVETYEFPGRRLLSVALVLPISIPPYVSGFAYAGFFDYSGIVQRFFRSALKLAPGRYPVVDVMNLPMAAIILGAALAPYVYLPVRAAFRASAGSTWETVRALGASSIRGFWTVALPLARPALLAGGSLVVMEVLSDYGLVSYFGLPTFSTAIFRVWFGTGDLTLALRLAFGLFALVFLARTLERRMRERSRYDGGSVAQRRPERRAPTLLLVAGMPILLGVALPLFQMLYWIVRHAKRVVPPGFLRALAGSLLTASAATALGLVVAVTVAFLIARRKKTSTWSRLSSFFSLGYAAPGAVMAVAFLSLYGRIDHGLNAALGLGRAVIGGSFVGLMIAYLVRYFAVAYEPALAGFDAGSRGHHEASRALGKGPIWSLFSVDLPLLRSTILSAALLLFVDVLRELPMTIILRPFGFETLATKALEYAADERLYQTALPALVLSAIGATSVVLLLRKETTNVRRP